ncbi:hypothetical protein KY290_011280 [Solanum tuberosum]|uniref:NB-ARC domain-containing protein n=1 Tax=Solanum tuberosum TaxID=4113 RepID=A0ABQ7W080_SOLTU|nr:hypothetical protein KY290_011280 [Solanum tuberosum]
MVNKWKDVEAHNLAFTSTTSQHVVEPIVGHKNEFEMMQDQLVRGASELEVVSIVGMGGIGKTTLASKIYNDSFIMSHFDVRAKATVSQEHCVRNLLFTLLSCISVKTDESDDECQEDGQLAD